jgi:hypothetical protein
MSKNHCLRCRRPIEQPETGRPRRSIVAVKG